MKRGTGFPTPLHHQLPVPGLGDGAGRAVVSNRIPHFCVGVCDFDGVEAASRNGGGCPCCLRRLKGVRLHQLVYNCEDDRAS